MKKLVLIGMVLAFVGVTGRAWSEPLAPSAPLKKEMAMFVDPGERDVPDASKVGMPAYPGSRFCTIDKERWGPTGWVEVHLLSKDPYEKVVQWYRKKMSGWYCKEWVPGTNFKCSDKDPGVAGNYDPETFNVVDVLKTDVGMPCEFPGTQTGITLNFQPD